jgi:uncharacterized membrane protein YkgB
MHLGPVKFSETPTGYTGEFAMKARCIWSNEKGEHLREIKVSTLSPLATRTREETVFVSPEHEREFRRFNTYELRYGRLFVGIILAGTVLLAAFALAGSSLGAGLTTIAMGIATLLFPFATPETVRIHGFRRSIQMSRRLGMLSVGLGVLAILLGSN